MRTTGDQHLVKKINKGIVLDTILQHCPISRSDISARVGLNKSTVSSLVSELIEEKLVYETGPGQSSGGRKPVMLMFNGSAGYSIGVDLGVNYIQVVLTDLLGAIHAEHRERIEDRSVHSVIPKLVACIRKVIDAAPPSAYGIVGIAAGVPGMVDSEGVVLTAPNLGWENIPLKSCLQQEFHVPVFIDNEANMGAIGEKTFGTAQHAANMIYISVGIGIGAGIIIQNELFRGHSGYAGEVGHMQIDRGHRGERNLDNQEKWICRCGNSGCWELYASEKALLRLAGANEAAQRPTEQHFDLQTLVQSAINGDPTAVQAFQTVGHALGIGIVNLTHTFNPELIVIGNRIVSAKELLLDAIKSTVSEAALPYHLQELDIVFSETGMLSGALGAASVVLERFFAERKAVVYHENQM